MGAQVPLCLEQTRVVGVMPRLVAAVFLSSWVPLRLFLSVPGTMSQQLPRRAQVLARVPLRLPGLPGAAVARRAHYPRPEQPHAAPDGPGARGGLGPSLGSSTGLNAAAVRNADAISTFFCA